VHPCVSKCNAPPPLSPSLRIGYLRLLFARILFSLSSPFNEQIHKFLDNMPSTTNIEKTQPWKAHWPAPAKQESGIEYGVQKGEIVVVDGTSAKVSVAKNDDTAGAMDKAK